MLMSGGNAACTSIAVSLVNARAIENVGCNAVMTRTLSDAAAGRANNAGSAASAKAPRRLRDRNAVIAAPPWLHGLAAEQPRDRRPAAEYPRHHPDQAAETP